jgi:hypothetical protein
VANRFIEIVVHNRTCFCSAAAGSLLERLQRFMAKAAIPLFHSRLLGKAIVHERELDAELFRF